MKHSGGRNRRWSGRWAPATAVDGAHYWHLVFVLLALQLYGERVYRSTRPLNERILTAHMHSPSTRCLDRMNGTSATLRSDLFGVLVSSVCLENLCSSNVSPDISLYALYLVSRVYGRWRSEARRHSTPVVAQLHGEIHGRNVLPSASLSRHREGRHLLAVLAEVGAVSARHILHLRDEADASEDHLPNEDSGRATAVPGNVRPGPL